MQVNLYSDDDVFIEQIREFVALEVLPHTREWEDAEAFPDTIWKALAKRGLLGMTLPESKGGRGLTCQAFCGVVRELAKGDPALSMNVAAINALAIGHIERYGSKLQQDAYLPGIVAGDIRLAWALTEPDAGSDARRVKTIASPNDGDPGKFRLNGKKMFITNGGKADLIVLMARVSETDMSAFLVETDQPGFRIDERIHTVGVSASNTVAFSLENVHGWHTPCTFEEAISLLHRGRLAIGAMALGIAEKALELAVHYSKHREQFNRRLCDMQSVQNMIADSAVDVEAARLLVENGARMYDLGMPIIREASMAKLFASEAANRVTNRALQIHGGRGMTRDFLIEKLWRDAKLTEIGEGASEIQKMVIAKQTLARSA